MFDGLDQKGASMGLAAIDEHYLYDELKQGIVNKKANFRWFAYIFAGMNVQTQVGPITNRFAWVQKCRDDGCVIEFPFVRYLDNPDLAEHPLVLGSGIKMFIQQPSIVYNSVILRYFYFTPFNSFTNDTFKKLAFTFQINAQPDSMIKDNQDLILVLLKQYMGLEVSDVGKYISISPASFNTKITHARTKFWVYFFSTDGSNKFLASLPFSIVLK